MTRQETDARIAAFLMRKGNEFPMLGLLEHNETRTVKVPIHQQVIQAAH